MLVINNMPVLLYKCIDLVNGIVIHIHFVW